MPDYSEYIIKENGTAKIYAEYRGDYSFLADVFSGPEKTMEFIRRKGAIEQSKFDQVYSAIFIDVDEQSIYLDIEAYWEEDGSGIFMTEIFVRLMQVQWPNWKVGLEVDGYLGRLKRLGVDYAAFLQEYLDSYAKYDWDRSKGVLLSSKKGGKLEFVWSDEHVYKLVPEGPKQFADRMLNGKIPQGRFPLGGMHCDVDANKMEFWYINHTPEAASWASKFWPDHTISFELLNYNRQFKSCGCNHFQQVIEAGQKKAIKYLEEEIVSNFIAEERSVFYSLYSQEMAQLALEKRYQDFARALEASGFKITPEGQR